jgi:hypothetical protein
MRKVLNEKEAWLLIANAKIEKWEYEYRLVIKSGDENDLRSVCICGILYRLRNSSYYLIPEEVMQKMEQKIIDRMTQAQETNAYTKNTGFVWPLTYEGQIARKQYAKEQAYAL